MLHKDLLSPLGLGAEMRGWMSQEKDGGKLCDPLGAERRRPQQVVCYKVGGDTDRLDLEKRGR